MGKAKREGLLMTVKEIKKKYTRIVLHQWTFYVVRLKVGNQSFTVDYCSCTRSDAEWMRDRLATAIHKIVEEANK